MTSHTPHCGPFSFAYLLRRKGAYARPQCGVYLIDAPLGKNVSCLGISARIYPCRDEGSHSPNDAPMYERRASRAAGDKTPVAPKPIH